MKFKISPDLNKELKRIKFHNQKLALKIEKQLILFEQNHTHTSLRVNKLTGNFDDVWSISIDMSVRMLIFLRQNEAYFFDIGTHNQVYKK